MTTTLNGNNYYLNLNDAYGNRLTVISNFISLDYARQTNGVGSLVLVLPYSSYYQLIQTYYQLEVWRSAANGTSSPYLELETIWIITYYKIVLSQSGELLLEVHAVDGPALLDWRWVVYYAGSAQAGKSGVAGNLMKAVVRENVSSTANDYTGTATTRGLSASVFTVQADLGDGASIDMQFAWQNVLAVLQDMANASVTAGTYIAFDVVSTGFGTREFRTYSGQRGVDHRLTTSNPVLLDPAVGNLAESSLAYDYAGEVTFVYSAGQGEGADRKVATSSNATRLGMSPFSRRETFTDARQSDTQAQVQDSADAALRAGRGMVVFDSKVIETPYTRYGIEYNFGDILPCQLQGQLIDCRLDKIHVSVVNSLETIDVVLQSVS